MKLLPFLAIAGALTVGQVHAQQSSLLWMEQADPIEQVGQLAQAPAPPAPPAPPQPPKEPYRLAETMRLMAINGSYLGIGVRDVNEERKKALNLKEERGAEITSVEEDSPAAKAGLKTADVVVEYNGQRVEGMEQFIRLVRETPAGREVKIGVIRNGAPVTLAARPDSGANRMAQQMRRLETLMPEIRAYTVESMPRPALNWQSVTLGIEAESLTEQLAGFFGVKQGVLVRSVTPGSVAEKHGIKAGDVITKVDDKEVSSARDITSQLRAARTKNETITLTTVRERKEQTLKVTFPETRRYPAPGARSVKAPLNL